MKKTKTKTGERAGGYESMLLRNYPPNSRFAEAYRSLRTNIAFAMTDSGCRSLLITSAGQKEGKTSTVINLAHTLCNAGKSVLMVDADLRNPVMTRIFAVDKSTGLIGLISDRLAAKPADGDLNGYGPSDLLRLLELQKATGNLKLSGGGEVFEFVFRHGEIVDLQWSNRPGDRKLAQILVKAGKITPDQGRMALGQQKSTGQRLGDVILATGMMKRDDLAGILSTQIFETMQQALQIRSGRFSFQASEISAFETAGFNPVDFRKIYQQAVAGAEALPYLSGEIRKAVVSTQTPGLYLLPSGGTPPNPSELLGSDRVPFILSQLKRQFDVILIDTPPILPASDGLLLASQVDGVLLVVKAGQVNRRLVAGTVEQLQTARGNVIGVVLNQVDTRRDGYYHYYYQKYYSAYYGSKG